MSEPEGGPPAKKEPDNLVATALAHPDDVAKLVRGIADAVADSLTKLYETQNRHERRLAYVVAYLLTLIIAAGAILTGLRILDPVSFAFLVGPIVGGLITYL